MLTFEVLKVKGGYRVRTLIREFDYPIETFEHFALFSSEADAQRLVERIRRAVYQQKQPLDMKCWLGSYLSPTFKDARALETSAR